MVRAKSEVLRDTRKSSGTSSCILVRKVEFIQERSKIEIHKQCQNLQPDS